MFPRLFVLLITLRSFFKTQHQLALENLALRQQLAMLRESVKRPRVSWFDQVFWMFARSSMMHCAGIPPRKWTACLPMWMRWG
jgi:hypothetical protein